VRSLSPGKALALLGYLAVRRQPLSREHLADLFWQDLPAQRGRANLSWTLHKLAPLLPGCLDARRRTVEFYLSDGCWIDLDALQALIAQGDEGSLAKAAALYRGEFLQGLALDGCADFELWLVGERERWRQRAERALHELIAHCARRGDCEEALRFARRLLALAPWREETHRTAIRMLAKGGQRGAALAQYRACVRALEAELGVAPRRRRSPCTSASGMARSVHSSRLLWRLKQCRRRTCAKV
jgi:DNA-binding SARP family transcriptional activator